MGVRKIVRVSTIFKALNVPKERPATGLGPSREFYEKHRLTLINNLMGLSCLFFLTPAVVLAMNFSTLMEQNLVTIWWAAFVTIWCAIQTMLSFDGDYWFTRVSPETGSCGARIVRWISGARESIVVTTPDYIETWKRLWVANTLDVLSAYTASAFMLTMFLWQLWHGAEKKLVACWFAAASTGVFCKLMGAKNYKGQNDNTYDPNKIWWFNFYHFNWHLFMNIACYLFTSDLCKTVCVVYGELLYATKI